MESFPALIAYFCVTGRVARAVSHWSRNATESVKQLSRIKHLMVFCFREHGWEDQTCPSEASPGGGEAPQAEQPLSKPGLCAAHRPAEFGERTEERKRGK